MEFKKVAITPELDGYLALPIGSGPFTPVILITEALGLNEDMLEGSAQKLAEVGFAVIAPDIFHGDIFDGTDWEPIMAKIKSIQDDLVMKEVGQTIDWITKQPDLRGDQIGCIGFCMGGRLAFLAHSVWAKEIKATAAFYGGGIAPVEDRLGRRPLLEMIDGMQGALFLGYGADDASITAEEHSKIVLGLSLAKKRFELQLFTAAGHAFLSVTRPNYRPEAAQEAWPTVFQFFMRHLGH